MEPIKVWGFFKFDQLAGIALIEPADCEGGRQLQLSDPQTHVVVEKGAITLEQLQEAWNLQEIRGGRFTFVPNDEEKKK